MLEFYVVIPLMMVLVLLSMILRHLKSDDAQSKKLIRDKIIASSIILGIVVINNLISMSLSWVGVTIPMVIVLSYIIIREVRFSHQIKAGTNV